MYLLEVTRFYTLLLPCISSGTVIQKYCESVLDRRLRPSIMVGHSIQTR